MGSYLRTFQHSSIRSFFGCQTLARPISVAFSSHSSSNFLSRQHLLLRYSSTFLSSTNFFPTSQQFLRHTRLSSHISGPFDPNDILDPPSDSIAGEKWNTAVKEAEKLVGLSSSLLSLRYLLSEEISIVLLSLRKLIGTAIEHPMLTLLRLVVNPGREWSAQPESPSLVSARDPSGSTAIVAQAVGLVVLLVAQAVNATVDQTERAVSEKQRLLAEMAELIAIGNAVHKSILNQKLLEAAGVAEKERSEMAGGNKLAALTGDFLLAKAAGGLARLNHPQVVDSMAQAIGDSVESSFTAWGRALQQFYVPCHSTRRAPLQLPETTEAPASELELPEWERFVDLAYGTLFSSACRSVARLRAADERLERAAADFGHHFARAFCLAGELRLSSTAAAPTRDREAFEFPDLRSPTEVLSAAYRGFSEPLRQGLECLTARIAGGVGVGSSDLKAPYVFPPVTRTMLLELLPARARPDAHLLLARSVRHMLDDAPAFAHSDARTALVTLANSFVRAK